MMVFLNIEQLNSFIAQRMWPFGDLNVNELLYTE